MVSAINSNDYYYLTYSVQAQDNKNIENEQSQKEIARYICNDYGSIRDENRPYATGICRSYSEYVGRQKNKILADSMGGISPLEAGKTYSLEEYESRKQDYYNKVNDFDFKQGFQDYMKELGCNNEEELSQYLPEKDRNDVISEAKKYLSWVSVSNPTVIPLLRDIDNYAQNIDFDTWKQFQNDLYSIDATGKPMTSLEVEGKAVKNLLNSLGIENSDLNSKSIDLFVLQNKCAYLKGESIDTDKLMEDFSEKSQIYLSNGGTWENFLEQYLNDSIEAVTKELEELTLLSEQTREQEQVNLTESFISTKIAQYKK